jgi:hypothetical protein
MESDLENNQPQSTARVNCGLDSGVSLTTQTHDNTHMPPTHTCPLAAYHKCPNSCPQTHTPRQPNHDSQHCAHAAHACTPPGGISTNPKIATHRHAPKSGQTTTCNTTTTPTCHPRIHALWRHIHMCPNGRLHACVGAPRRLNAASPILGIHAHPSVPSPMIHSYA